MNQMIEPYPELSLFNQNLQEIIEISLAEGIPYLGFGQDGVIRTPVGPINSF